MTKRTPEMEAKVMELRSQGRTYRAIAKEVGIPFATVQNIIGRHGDNKNNWHGMPTAEARKDEK